MVSLGTKEISQDLGLGIRTVQKYIKTGFLPAQLEYIRGNPIYGIESSEYLAWKQKHFSGLKRGEIKKSNSHAYDLGKEELSNEVEEWLSWCETGMLTGKPIKVRTVELYRYYFGLYIEKLCKYPKKPLISIANARKIIGSLPIKSFSTKMNIYSALMSFAKYLIVNLKLELDFRDKLKELRPKRSLPARKTSLNEKQIDKLLEYVDSMKGSASFKDKIRSRAILMTFLHTGLRVSELANLTLRDVDLESRMIKVRLGKGNKDRAVGISEELFQVLCRYLEAFSFSNSEYFFVGRFGDKYQAHSLTQKIRRIASAAGFEGISPHSLRRSFVTINAAKGKPLNHLRIACGHADITTTQGYCMTSQDEVIEAMKGW